MGVVIVVGFVSCSSGFIVVVVGGLVGGSGKSADPTFT